MVFGGLQLVWKQVLLGTYAGITAIRGTFMIFRPRTVLGWMRKTVKRVVEKVFQLMGRAMPRVDHEHQVLIVRIMGMTSLFGAGVLIWWLVRR